MKINDVLFEKKGISAKIIYNDSLDIEVSTFEIKQFISGKLFLYMKILKQNSQNIETINKAIFKGKSEDGFVFELDITKSFSENPFKFMFFDSMSKRIQVFNPVILKSESIGEKDILKQYFTNFLFDYNSVQFHGFSVKIEDIEFNFNNNSEYKESKEIIQNLYLPQITGFCESKIKNNYDNLKKITKNILELISYSQRQFIQVPYEEILNKNKEILEIHLFPQTLRQARSGFTVVESSLVYESDQLIVNFIEKTYANYIEWKEKIKLDYSLTYYLLSFIPQQGEVEYILVFTATESLLRHYEDYFLTNKKYKLDEIKKQQFQEKIESKLNVEKEQKNILLNPENKFFYVSLSFDESLNILYQGKITSEYKDESFGFKLKRDDFDCKAPGIRNNLMHKGEFKDYSDMTAISSDMKNMVYMFDKIFLTILGYKDYYRDYRDIEKWIKLS